MLVRIRFRVASAVICVLGAALVFASTSNATSANDAQLVPKSGLYAGNNLFMGTTKLEIGARANGSFGSNVNAPAGYHPRNLPASNILGFRANPTECDWEAPTCLQVTQGDFFTPGWGSDAPYEAWALQVGPAGTSRFNTVTQTQVDGAFGPPVPTGPSAVWTATEPKDGIDVRFDYSIPTTGWVLNAQVTLTNTTGAAINDVYFLRGVDADNCAADPIAGRPPPPLCYGDPATYYGPIGWVDQTFETFDTVRSNGPQDGLAQVTATQTDGTYLALQLVSATARAFRRVDSYSFISSGNLAAIYNGTDLDFASDVGNTVRGDHSMFIVAKVPSIAAGASVTLPVKYVLKGQELAVSKAGTGSGTVTSDPAAIDCGTSCSSLYGLDSSVTLTAAPSDGSIFTGWGGACSGSNPNPTCTVTMSEARSVTATFDIPEQLSVTKSGAGSGSVSSSPAGIDCGSSCSHDFALGEDVTLTASAAPGSQFAGWGGACSRAGDNLSCVVAMSEARSVSAAFEPAPAGQQPLSVSRTGWGRVVGGGIDCGTECVKDLPDGEKVTLTAYPDWRALKHGWRLDSSSTCPGDGWKPAAGRSHTCDVTMDRARSAKAVFRRISNRFEVLSTRTVVGISTRVSVPGPGTLTQTGTRMSDGERVEACTTSERRARLAGKLTLYCRPTTGTRIAQGAGPVKVRVCTHYRPENGTRRTQCRRALLRTIRPGYTG